MLASVFILQGYTLIVGQLSLSLEVGNYVLTCDREGDDEAIELFCVTRGETMLFEVFETERTSTYVGRVGKRCSLNSVVLRQDTEPHCYHRH